MFEPFNKIARLNRPVIVTEKIDGTNAQIHIELTMGGPDEQAVAYFPQGTAGGLNMFAASRSRYLDTTSKGDNFGFAKWVKEHAEELVALGPGRHFGEWWGSGIQRGYGLTNGEKRFSLFNTARWAPLSTPFFFTGDKQEYAPSCCSVVPVLYHGDFDSFSGHRYQILENLREHGSWAAPGFKNPEGIVVFHTASGTLFKETFDNDGQPKSAALKVAA